MVSPPSLTIVMPARNERTRLPETLEQIETLKKAWPRLHVLVVDDGSEDETTSYARSVGTDTMTFGRHVGVGNAVRRGILSTKTDLILLCDADGAVPFDEVWPLYEAIQSGYDIAVGSRTLNPESVEVAQPQHRQVMGKAWKYLVASLLRTSVSDTQCSFKLFRRDAAHRVFRRTRSRGFAFHAESMHLAMRSGLKVADLPVRWRDQAGSKISIVGDSSNMAKELLQTKWRHCNIRGQRP